MKPASAVASLLFPLLSSSLVGAGPDLGTFVSDRCLDCHDDSTKKGGFSMEHLDSAITPANAKDWLKVLQQIERQNMPPADKDQPTREERHALVQTLEDKLVAQARAQITAAGSAAHRPATLRRLNRTEYRLTIRDLLHLEVSSFDPSREFPEDTRVHGFASNGEKLVTSSFLLRQYLESAEQIVTRAAQFRAQPEVQQWHLLPPFDRTTRGFAYAENAYYQKTLRQRPPHQSLTERMRGLPQVGYAPVDELRAGVPESGWYQIRIRAEAKHRYVDLDPKDPALDLRKQKFPSLWDPSEPIRLGLYTGTLEGIDPENKEALDTAATGYQAGQRQLAIWDLPDDQATWLECRVWLDHGQFPRLGFPNGPSDSNNRLRNYFKANFERLLNAEQRAKYEQDKSNDWNLFMWFQSPRIQISNVEVTGPLHDTWPPESHRAIFGNVPYRSQLANAVLKEFAVKAWRRPVADAELVPLLALVQHSEQAGMNAEVAIQEGIKAILCSPEFLYREEKESRLTDYELASRLSYFLWSSMPDETLMKLARNGEIARPQVLRREALRLLADPRSEAFVEEFLNGWLDLRKLGTMAPDVHKFATYYDNDLEPAMRMETRLYFRQLLHTNGPATRLLDSDYTLLNQDLARLYGMNPDVVTKNLSTPVASLTSQELVPDGAGHAPSLGFTQVKLADRRRGGVLGHASVLTLTANGVDTSPVIRGVWLLENILGATPSPPPPNVPAIEPDIRGAKTIRDQLMKHQASGSCRSCHRQIDPPGFALENFDAIGRWRGHYINNKTALPVDASGQFGSTHFDDVTGFKAELLNRRDQFARCLVEKLFIHALGRDLEVTDRPAIRHIVESTAEADFPLREIIAQCVESEIFRQK
ncbi:DUF1592 domain-containing protein [Verrucomicrobium sp. BvORR034]|uniref:DUF1592 domain-containing protein n=1 Tax=Verrucomicrobium sp. BvORR034 TaxID=1396418 RepID=UPI000678F37E|nr:DUF1592 domain-containing protein [Verrucomicrobium sp. BvORR034]